MFHRGILRFAFALCVVAALSAADDKVEEPTTVKISPEPPQPSSSSSVAPTSKPTTPVPTTPEPTTIAPTTIAPTTAKPTTTVAPRPTTEPSPTSAPTTPPTTAAPTTQPTTPKPTPPPEPEEGTWAVRNETANRTCVLVHMMAVVDVYDTTDNKTMVEQVNVPKTANATGTCGEMMQTITLYWPYNKTENNTVELTFKKNESNFELANVTVKITRTGDQNKSIPLVANHTKDEFITPIKMSYKCKKGQLLNLTSAGSNVTVASFHISNVQFQAFGNMTKQDFAAAKDCEPYETPDVVPIAVGCALIALIVVVLVGYLIGRRRNQARGYLSM